jgi:mRNA-degrading endonuclease toxin of MazEF toxin-antitoxin module
LLDQIRTVDKARLGNRIGQLPAARIEEVNRAIRLSLAV